MDLVVCQLPVMMIMDLKMRRHLFNTLMLLVFVMILRSMAMMISRFQVVPITFFLLSSIVSPQYLIVLSVSATAILLVSQLLLPVVPMP